MPLFGDADGPKLKLTRPVIIAMAVLGGLLVIVVVLAILLSSGVFSRRAPEKAAVPTVEVKVADVEETGIPSRVGATVPPAGAALTPPAGAATVPPAGAALTPPAGAATVPPAGAATAPPAQGGDGGQPVAVSTPIPAPTVESGGGGAVVQSTPGGEGGGEIGELPGVSSGLPWLIPAGVLLLVSVLWWRWRRARAEG